MNNKKKLASFCKLPNNMHIENRNITPKDEYIYFALKYCNGPEGCHPSLATLSKLVGASIPTIRTCINNLMKAEYIKVIKCGNQGTRYEFLLDDKSFSMIPRIFIELKDKDLTFAQRAFILSIFQHTYKFGKNNEYGKLTWSDAQLAEKLNLDRSTVSRINNSLRMKNYMIQVNKDVKHEELGFKKGEKIYFLDKLNLITQELHKQAKRLDKFECNQENHEDRITFIEKKLKDMEESHDKETQETQKIKKENKHLSEELSIALNKIKKLEEEKQALLAITL